MGHKHRNRSSENKIIFDRLEKKRIMADTSRDRSPGRRDRRDTSAPRRSTGPPRGGGPTSRRAPPERRIFVSNIPFEMKWQEVKDLFRDNVGDVSYVELFNDENDKPRGCGILEFSTEDLAKNAVEKMHRYEYKGRKIVVKEDFDTERDKYGRITKGNRSSGGGDDRQQRSDRSERRDHGPSMGGGGAGGYGDTYGLSPQFLESLGIFGPLHTRLFVANLSYDVDERKLREVFRLAGRVVMVELNRGKEGKSRGHAVIEYDHPVEAVQAISMFNEQYLFDRKMTARFDKAPGPTPEELAQLPSRLPEGLGGVGMGLGSGGNPLTEVAKNLPGSTPTSGNTMGAQAEATGNNGTSGLNVMDVVRTLQVAKQLDMMGGGNSLGNLTGALSNLSGGNGGMSSNMGNNMMASAGGMMGSSSMGAGVMGSSSMGAGPMSGPNPMGGSSMSGGPSMSAGAMGNSMGGMSRGPSMSEYDRPSMGDMGSRSAPSGYSSSTAPSGPSGGPSSGYGRDG